MGFHIEILSYPYSCLHKPADNYGALLVLDAEDYWSESEMARVRHDVEQEGLSLVIASDWWNERKIRERTYLNVVTFEEWTPFMGGSNIPSLNSLLAPYNI